MGERMNDLISRNKILDFCNQVINRNVDGDDMNIVVEAFKAFKAYVNSIPSAQPQHMKGKWIHDGYDFPHGNDWIHCSICGKKGINVPADLTNFCPNCGADMRGEELDETD